MRNLEETAMSTGRIEKLWMVVDPSEVSTLDGILFEASIESLILQVKGGLAAADRPRMYLDRESAQADVLARLAVVKRLSALACSGTVGDVWKATTLRLLDVDGAVVFERDLVR